MSKKIEITADRIREVNETSYKAFISCTGGGQSFIHEFMQYSGASKTIAGAYVPYHQNLLHEFIGRIPKKYCSEQTAANMAVASYKKCVLAVDNKKHAIGIGITCTLATDGERDGREHNVYIAAHTKEFSASNHIKLPQGLTRSTEELIVKELIFQWLYALSVTRDTNFDCRAVHAADLLKAPSINISTTGILVVYPGSYDPWHYGHERVYNIAEMQLGITPVLEITMSNVDKGLVDYITLEDRLKTIPREIPYMVTPAPTFVEKMIYIYKLYPDVKGIVFVVGVDTWNRIWLPLEIGTPEKVYDIFKNNNVKFLVFPRSGFKVTTGYMDDLIIYGDVIEEFKVDISSSELRAATDVYLDIDQG